MDGHHHGLSVNQAFSFDSGSTWITNWYNSFTRLSH